MHGEKNGSGENDGCRLLLGELLCPVVKRVYINSLNGNPRRGNGKEFPDDLFPRILEIEDYYASAFHLCLFIAKTLLVAALLTKGTEFFLS
jgi:hypothetical protein